MKTFKDYLSVERVAGPLVFVQGVKGASYGEVVKIKSPGAEIRTGQVLEINENFAVVQVFEGTSGLDTQSTSVRFTGEPMMIPVSMDMLGRVFSGTGEPLDHAPPVIPEDRLEVSGEAINPYARDQPNDFIQTGISTIDGMNTLVRGQKLPIFSGAGLPHNQLAIQIARQARVLGREEEFAVIFAAMGITQDEAAFFKDSLESTGAMEKSVLFLTLADDPTAERLLVPRMALTTAEYLAYKQGMHVLVILTDMTNYCESLREVASARSEVPGRRGYPGYMYTDLATIYERAGRIKGKRGSITQMPVLTMPSDDITHPIPDLTGYITEGQIVLSRGLHRKGIYPPVDVLPSLSRLWKLGVGPNKTREDHEGVANEMYRAYAEGRDLETLVAIVGDEALSSRDRRFLEFSDAFEKFFVKQGPAEGRDITRTLDIAWELLSILPESELKKVRKEHIQKYLPRRREDKGGSLTDLVSISSVGIAKQFKRSRAGEV